MFGCAVQRFGGGVSRRCNGRLGRPRHALAPPGLRADGGDDARSRTIVFAFPVSATYLSVT
jgi:hypothetical protein